ncbi:MAG TPA: hypothetical protein IAB15_05550 [Candidatus Ornithoclostridium faecigallinarum]|nr:hypothetical protein [Candidatus Ornithoclostridium faecigallinarum]
MPKKIVRPSAKKGDDLDGIMLKKALGYYVEESVEEYDENDNVTKRRVSMKYVPPDTAAIKAVLERESKLRELKGYSDEQLAALKAKLLSKLKSASADGEAKK